MPESWATAAGIALDHTADVPLGVQLDWVVRAAVASGRLRAGDRLPGLREVADQLGVNHNTVRAAVAKLEADGLLETRHGSGTFVAAGAATQLRQAALLDEVAQRAQDAGVAPRELAAALYVAEPTAHRALDRAAVERRRCARISRSWTASCASSSRSSTWCWRATRRSLAAAALACSAPTSCGPSARRSCVASPRFSGRSIGSAASPRRAPDQATEPCPRRRPAPRRSRPAPAAARYGARLGVVGIPLTMRIALGERASGVSARDQVYLALREAIVSAELEPGRRLSENELAERLGVSRTPVREALVRLRDERLVAIVPQLGTFVTLISNDGVEDAAFVREALECAAIRLATERARPEDLAELQANLAAQDRAQEAGDADAFDRLDDALHRRLCELSGREIAWHLSRRANGHLDRVRRLSLPEPGYLGEMVAEHRQVVAAVADRDPDHAEATLRHHLRMVLSSLPHIREVHPDYFEESE